MASIRYDCGRNIRARKTTAEHEKAATKTGAQFSSIRLGLKPARKWDTTKVIAVKQSCAKPAAIENVTHPFAQASVSSGTRTTRYASSTSIEYLGLPMLRYASAQMLLSTILMELLKKKRPRYREASSHCAPRQIVMARSLKTRRQQHMGTNTYARQA